MQRVFFDFVTDPPIPTQVFAAVTNGGEGIASEPLNPLMQQILRNTTISKFNGKEEIFGNWKWDFQQLCSKYAQEKEINESTKTILLELCLSETLLQEFRLMQRTQSMTFTPFLARLEERFGRGQLLVGRAKWERIAFSHMGKIKVQNLKEFEVKFLDAWKDVSDSSPEEGHRVLLTKLTEWLIR